MKFTKQQREKIDILLKESEILQKQNNNKLYTSEEVWGAVMEVHNKNVQNCLQHTGSKRLN